MKKNLGQRLLLTLALLSFIASSCGAEGNGKIAEVKEALDQVQFILDVVEVRNGEMWVSLRQEGESGCWRFHNSRKQEAFVCTDGKPVYAGMRGEIITGESFTTTTGREVPCGLTLGPMGSKELSGKITGFYEDGTTVFCGDSAAEVSEATPAEGTE